MKIIRQSWRFLRGFGDIEALGIIEIAGRTCYKSEDKIEDDSATKFVRQIIASGHHSVLEHASVSVRIITDRGVTHETVRHRLASYSQESTRYCNYSQLKFGREITVILPVWFEKEFNCESRSLKGINKEDMLWMSSDPYFTWQVSCQYAEQAYFKLLDLGQSPQQARSVLPNSLKTEIVMTANLREWRHFFSLRCSPAAHPQMRDLALSMLRGFKGAIPVLFDDLCPEEPTTC